MKRWERTTTLPEMTADQVALVEKNLGLVGYQAKRFLPIARDNGKTYEDLFSAGILGLVIATYKYEDGHGTTFSTYATLRIRSAIIDELKDSHVIHVPHHNKPHKTYSMDTAIERFGSQGEFIARQEADDEDLKAFHAAIARLPERERTVIGMRIDGYSLDEIGQFMGGTTREWIRKVEAQAIARIRRALGLPESKKNYRFSVGKRDKRRRTDLRAMMANRDAANPCQPEEDL